MSRTIEGVYRNGKIELSEQPQDAENSRVLVTFLEPAPSEEQRQAAIKALIEQMKRGLHLGGGPYPTREEIYDRQRGRSGSV